jgi:hypothetical protein
MRKIILTALALALILPAWADLADARGTHERPKRVNRRVFGPDSDWTPASPTTNGGVSPEHWYKADAGTYVYSGTTTAAVSDGDVVGLWQDQASNADDVNQATTDNKPTLQLAELKGEPVLRFDGTNDYLQGAFTGGGGMSQPLMCFMVAKLKTSAVNDDQPYNALDGDDATHRCLLSKYESPDPDEWRINAGGSVTGNTADSDWNIWSVLFAPTSQFWLNGASEGSGSAGGQAPDGLTVGTSIGLVGFWLGDIAEIVLYDSNLSTADKNQVGKYLGKKYGITYTNIP